MNGELRPLQRALADHGYDPGPADGIYGPRTRRSVMGFQRSWAGGAGGGRDRLRVDGIPGPLTTRAAQGLPWLSPHFRATEFRSGGDGTLRLAYQLLDALEALRASLRGLPLVIHSGYRDPAHNARVGGAAASQHLYGTAADLGYVCSLDHARGLQVFSGLGHKQGRIRHVDVRHVARVTNPTPSATITRPAVWAY